MGQSVEWSGGHSVEWSSEYAFDRSPEDAARAVMRAQSYREDADRALEMVRLQAVRACTERGLSVRQTATMLGLTKSAVGRIKRALDAAPHGIWASEPPPRSISTLPIASDQVRAAWAHR
ncbi:helix-turn-helix domain-containing protein [Rhodococcus erythropolis]|uniref:helix-turn-helix domain-containing protein n=1 Tax=Rhodococcus erythropolis TaxID=1833 RepID=UPI001BE59955|nr:helix-turn-helix domain-containing protein [Rhodococcus erythropolis]MBT2269602.1 helix-turn-helix domain-containing protein [Rhodococcus erythropolis]